MDALTHGLASFAVTRAFFPHASRKIVAAAVIAGTAADLDRLSALAGPAAFFGAYRACSHSILTAFVIAALAAGATPLLWKEKDSARSSFARGCAVTGLAALLHLGMDLCQGDGVALTWPFRETRFALDWVASFDLWMLLALLAGTFAPMLFQLVTEEIGARSKGPRGRVGAILALGAISLFVAARALLHSNAVVLLNARTYRGESPRRVAAFAQSLSPFEWRAIVETERALYQVVVPARSGAMFFPHAAVAIYKPEGSAVLDAARDSGAARRFLSTARFPKATIEKTAEGFRCEFRDLRFAAEAEAERAVAVRVALGENGKVRTSEIVWEKELRR